MKTTSLQFQKRPSAGNDTWAGRRQRRFPQTDYHYHAAPEATTIAAPASGCSTTSHVAEMRSLRQLSRQAVGSESRWQFAFEATVLALVVGIVAWPLLSLLTLISVNPFGG